MVQRSKRSLDKARLTNSMVSSLNSLSSTTTQNTGNSPLSLATQRALGRLGDAASVYVRGLTDHSTSVQSFDTPFVDYQSPAAAYATETDSLHIVADAVSLPTDTTSFSLVDALPPRLRQLYSTPDPALFSHNPADEPSRRFHRQRSLFGTQLGKRYSSNTMGDGPSFLQQAAHRPKTRAKYVNAVRRFLDYAHLHALPMRNDDDLDIAMDSFFHDLYITNNGKLRSVAQSALSGVRMLKPGWNPLFGRSRLTLRGWERLVPTVSYPPLTWGLTVCIASILSHGGHFDTAVGLLLAFDCFLRAGELVSIRFCDVADVGDLRFGPRSNTMSLRIPLAKTGTNQFVTVARSSVKRLLRIVMKGKQGTQFLFPFCTKTLLSRFKASCKLLGLSDSYVVHSLRHGGATHAHLHGVSVEDILLRGRWASTKSARIYIQSGRALLMSMQIPDKAKSLIPILSADVYNAIHQPQLPLPPHPTTPATPTNPPSPPAGAPTPTPAPSPAMTRSRALARYHTVYLG